MNTIIRTWMPRQARQADKVFPKEHMQAPADSFDDTKCQLMYLELLPHGIIQGECIGGDIGLILYLWVTIGFFPWRFVDGESSIGRCVALVGDDGYTDLMGTRDRLPESRIGDC